MNGNVSIAFSGDGVAGRSTDADLMFTNASGTTHLVLVDARATADDAGVITANAGGSVTTSTLDATFQLANVTWAQGDFCPSGGTLVLDESQAPVVTIEFLASTPVDGTVSVKVGGAPATTQVLGFCAP